jgi:hypothetical protein
VDRNPAVIEKWQAGSDVSSALPNGADAACPSHDGPHRHRPGGTEAGPQWLWIATIGTGFIAYFYSIIVLSSVAVLLLGIALILVGMTLQLTSVLKHTLVDDSSRMSATPEPAEKPATPVSAAVRSAETIIATASQEAADNHQTAATPEDKSPHVETVASPH